MSDHRDHARDRGVEGRPVDDDAWSAILARDTAMDGRFVYAVRTTGVYCRPSCPSRRPRRTNARLFDSAEAAEAAGYRACRRCEPGRVSHAEWAVAQVQGLLERDGPTPTLAELGRAVGLSPTYLQRVFKRATGLSPRQYAAALKAERLSDRLASGDLVVEAQYAAGYGSGRAAYEAADRALGMTPGRYRRGGEGVSIAYAFFDTPIGRALVAATERGVCALHFGADADGPEGLRRAFPKASLRLDPSAVAPYAASVRDALGRGVAPEVPLDVEATDFQRRVWSALRAIPAGETRSYRQVAEAIGEPTASRAVARACATNPVALVIPCHRVVRASGELGGYRWGVERKRAVLERETRSAGRAAGAEATEGRPAGATAAEVREAG